MPRLFSRIISFRLDGEIYDNHTTPEDIIKNYEWKFKDYNGDHMNCGDKCFLEADHKDHRGRVTGMQKMQKIQRYKKPDTNYFII
jgi:hypothetical protein